MTHDEFWALIAKVNTDALRAGNEDAALRPLQNAVNELPPDSIRQFHDQLSTALYQLDGRQFADNAGRSGQSDDGFLYARCFVVGCGRETFSATVADPTKMPKSLDHWFESILYCAGEALGDPAEYIETSVSYESGSNEALW